MNMEHIIVISEVNWSLLTEDLMNMEDIIVISEVNWSLLTEDLMNTIDCIPNSSTSPASNTHNNNKHNARPRTLNRNKHFS